MPEWNIRESSILRKLPVKLLAVSLTFIVALFLFAFITNEVIYKRGHGFDNHMVAFLAKLFNEDSIAVMKFFTFFGSGTFLIPAYLIIIGYLFGKRRWSLGVNVAIIGITSTALSQWAKRFFQRPRPGLPLTDALQTYSFPSGHAFSTFILSSVLVYLLWRSSLSGVAKWILATLLLSFSFMTGLSRVMLRMHYPTDVIAGFCLALVWVIVCFFALNRITRTRSTKQ